MEQDFDFTRVEQLLVEQASAKRVPFSGGFELTPYCNLSCRMCYVRETKQGLSVLSGQRWLEIGREAAHTGTLCVILTGGEPLLHPDFRMIFSGLKALGMVLTINTNGTLIDEAMANFLAENMPRRVNISLYADSREGYQELCGIPEAFDRTIRAIELLQTRNVPVKINITPNTINYPYLGRMLDICKAYNLPYEVVPYLFEPLRKCEEDKQKYRLPPAQMADVRFLIDTRMLEKKDFFFRRVMCYEMHEHFSDSAGIEGTQPIRCRAGVSSFWVCWDGKMNLCAVTNGPGADVCSLGFAGAWEKAKTWSDSIRVPARCSACSLRQFCSPCAAVSLHETGDFSKIAPSHCQTAQIYVRMMASGIRKEKKPETENERNES